MLKELSSFKKGDCNIGDYFTLKTPTFGEFDMQLSGRIGNKATFVSVNASEKKVCITKSKTADKNELTLNEALNMFYNEIPENIREHIVETDKGMVWVPSLFDVIGDSKMPIFTDDKNRSRIRGLHGRYRGEEWWLETKGRDMNGHYTVDTDGGIIATERDKRFLSFVPVFTLDCTRL